MVSRRNLIKGTVALSSVLCIPYVAKAQPIKFKWANSLAGAHPFNTNLRRALDNIKQQTNSDVEITLFSDGQLGGDSDMLSQVRSGALDFYTPGGVTVSTLVELAGIMNMPFAFRDYNTVWKAVDGGLSAIIGKSFEKVGLYAFEKFWDNGFRQITSGTRPIKEANDLKNFKIRVPSSPINTSLFRSLGASPTVINLGDAYTALQTKVVDGQENPLVTIYTSRFFEVQKYCSLSNHIWDAFIPVANLQIWSSLPRDVQTVIAKNLNETALIQREEVKASTSATEKALEAAGLAFNVVDPKTFREALQAGKFYETWRSRYGAEAWAMLEKYSGSLI